MQKLSFIPYLYIENDLKKFFSKKSDFFGIIFGTFKLLFYICNVNLDKQLTLIDMKTTDLTISQLSQKMLAHCENVLKVCNSEINREANRCYLDKCNSIVINKERMMTVTTDENHMTTYEFSPLYPTYFTPSAANRIVNEDIYKDVNGNRIMLEIVGKLGYYELLKEKTEKQISLLKTLQF